MRTKENHAIPTREFLLQKGALHDFGPNTLQLKDNWRMVTILLSHLPPIIYYTFFLTHYFVYVIE